MAKNRKTTSMDAAGGYLDHSGSRIGPVSCAHWKFYTLAGHVRKDATGPKATSPKAEDSPTIFRLYRFEERVSCLCYRGKGPHHVG